MNKKIVTILLLGMLSLALSGCQPFSMSNFTGKGTLATSDVEFPKKPNTTPVQPETENENSEKNTEGNKNTEMNTGIQNKPETPPAESEKEEIKNKTGIITYKSYIFQGQTANNLSNSIITTEAEYDALIGDMADYTNKNNLSKSVLGNYFLVVIPVNSSSSSWEYSVDSVKNDEKLTVTVLCEKPSDSKEDGTNQVIVVAVSKTDMPNIPSLSGINIKHNAYTI